MLSSRSSYPPADDAEYPASTEEGSTDRMLDALAQAGAQGLRSSLQAVVLLALLALSWRAIRRCHHHRLHGRPAALPEKLQTWEGEGGRPDPEPATESSAANPLPVAATAH